MVYKAQAMRLNEVQLINETEDGRVVICEDINSKENKRYSVFVTEDHEIIASLHRIYAGANNISKDTKINYFSDNGKNLIIFPYVLPRPIKSFFMGSGVPLFECSEIAKNYILSLMTADVPWEILYLIIDQGQVNINRDNSVFISYAVDLSGIDETITEKDCVALSAKELISLFSDLDDKKGWNLLTLLKMKSEKNAFNTFSELYRDINIAASGGRKKGIFKRIGLWFSEHKDRLFKVLLVISLILLIFTLITLLTNAIFGDVPWLRIFIRSFERIGTESLVQ